MPEETPDAKLRTRSALIAACAVSAVGAVYLVWTIAKGPLPHPPLHSAVTTAIGVGTVIAWLFYIAAAAGARRHQELVNAVLHVEMARHADTSALSRHLYRIESLVNQTGDEATDRIVGVVNAVQKTVESRVTVLEAAVSDHMCRGYTDGYADATAGRAPVRNNLRAINGRRP